MKKDKFRSIESQEVIFPTSSGSVRLSTDQTGKVTIGALTAPGVAEAFVVDPINNEVFASKIKFPDGSSFDSAIDLGDLKVPLFLLKPNKIFFKYDTDGNPIDDQTITLTFDTQNIIDLTPTITFVPAIDNPPTLGGEGDTRTITVEQFDLFGSDEVRISVRIGEITDSVTIYKVQNGTTYLQGGLSNPVTILQSSYDTNGNIFIEDKPTILAAQGGKFYVFKDGQDITNDPRITYRVSTDDITTEGLSVSIDQDTGVYTIDSFDETKEIGVATFEAVDSKNGQILQARYTISIVKQGIEGPAGPKGETGATGTDAKTLSISYTDGQIAYDSEGKNPVTNKQDSNGNYIIEIEAQESSNHEGPVTYEFLVTEPGKAEATLQKGSSSTLILSTEKITYTNSNFTAGYKFINDTKDDFGGGKIITVRTYENDSEVPSTQDQTKIYATKDGSDSLTIGVENSSHTFPAEPQYDQNGEVTGYNVTNYVGGGSIIEVYFGNEELVGNLIATTTEQLQNGQFRAEVIQSENIVAATNFETVTKTVNGSPVNYFYTGDPSNFDEDADIASLTYLIVGKSSTGVVKSGLTKLSYTKSKKGDKGNPGSTGSSVKAVKLTSNDYQIAYSTNGTNPNPSSITLTAAASNHEGTVTYKFYKGSTEVSSGTSHTYTTPTTGEHSIPSTKFSKFVYSVKTFEGTEEIASDSITVFATKDGEGSVTIIVPNNNHTFNADSEGNVTSFAGGGSEIQVYFGNTECQGTISTTLNNNFSFRVSDVATSNVTFPATKINTIAGSKSLKLADPTALLGSNGTATLSIEVRADSTTTQTFTQVCSYNKSQDGKTALDEQIYSFSKTQNVNGVLRAFGWRDSSTNANDSDSYRHYTGEFTYSNAGAVETSTDASYGGSVIKFNDTDNGRAIFSDFIPVNINLTYELKLRFKTNSTNYTFYIASFDQNKQWITNHTFKTDNSFAWNDWKILLTGQGTDSTTLSDGVSTHFRTTPGKNVKYVRIFFYDQSPSSFTICYIDYFSIKEAKASLDSNGGLPGSELTKELGGFWFTDDGKLRIGSSKLPSNSIFENLVSSFDTTSDIQIYSNESATNATAGGIPDISFVNVNQNGYAHGKISFWGYSGLYYDLDQSTYYNSSTDKYQLAERASIFSYQKDVSNYMGSSNLAFFVAPGITQTNGAKGYNIWNSSTSAEIAVKPNISPRCKMIIFGDQVFGFDERSNSGIKFGHQVSLSQGTSYFHIDDYDLYLESGKIRLGFWGGTTTPAILVHANDYNTGISFPDGNTFSFISNGKQRFSVSEDAAVVLDSGKRIYYTNSSNSGTDYSIPMLTFKAYRQYSFFSRDVTENSKFDIKHQYDKSGGFFHLKFYHTINTNAAQAIGYISGGETDNTKMNFTGQHRNISKTITTDSKENFLGLIVVSDGTYSSPGSNSITINEALPEISLSSKRNQKSVFGVISDKEDPNSSTREYGSGKFVSIYNKLEGDDRFIINSLGEGGIWVSNINGNLENGDYITTCEIPGYGMKQDDDLLHNYTVAKITCDCDFDLQSPIYICEEFEWEGQTYRKAFVGCTYHCG